MATTKTELYNNGTLVATKTSAPFNTFDWTPASGEVGSASLTVKRYEDGVLVATSAAVGGTVDAASGTYDADYQAALDYMTANSIAHPSSAEKSATNQKIIDLKSSGIWSQLDQLLIFNSEDSAAAYNNVDLKGLRLATDNGTITYSASGKKGDGSTGYIDTKFIPSTDAAAQTNTDFSIGFKIFDETTLSTIVGGRAGDSSSSSQLLIYKSGTNLSFKVFQASPSTVAIYSIIGANHISRVGTTVKHSVDSVVKHSYTASGTLPADEIFLMALNDRNSPVGHSEVGYSWYYSGANLEDKKSTIATILG
jgi:hypothetical protein